MLEEAILGLFGSGSGLVFLWKRSKRDALGAVVVVWMVGCCGCKMQLGLLLREGRRVVGVVRCRAVRPSVARRFMR
jgi:hypothetical protein